MAISIIQKYIEYIPWTNNIFKLKYFISVIIIDINAKNKIIFDCGDLANDIMDYIQYPNIFLILLLNIFLAYLKKILKEFIW